MSGEIITTIRFSEEDLALFSEASGDRNPLHLSASYAARTVYGQQVVFGALGAIACLGSIQSSPGQRIARLTADFHRPIFLGVDYQVGITKRSGATVVRLFDGSVPVLTLAVVLGTADGRNEYRGPHAAVFERSEPARWNTGDLRRGRIIEGRWRTNPLAFNALCKRWNVTADRFATETLLWGSYLVGMEIPGYQALFFKFSLDFQAISATAGPLTYRATIESMNTRISQLRIGVDLSSGGVHYATGKFLSFVQADLSPVSGKDVSAVLPISNVLSGKVALVIGASRGLGAATACALALQGASVVALSRSGGSDFGTALPAEVAARISAAEGDAASIERMLEVRNHIRSRYGRLDYLICNAFPAIPALRMEPNGHSRISAYLRRAVDLVLAPLCACLELLNESAGCAAIVSTIAVEKPVRDWPHYVAAKNAIEALARVAPMQYPRISSVVIRPERLLTEMTNTPLGRQNAVPPSHIAAEIVERLRNPPPAGTTEILLPAGKISESHLLQV